MEKKSFIPVILGTDINAYGMAKTFHEAYGVKSIAVGKGRLFTTENSSIVDVKIFEDLGTDNGFLQRLLTLGQTLKNDYKQLVLVASSDGYAESIIKNKKALSTYYEIPFVDESLMVKLNSKEAFYELCEAHQIPYPKTHYILSGVTTLEAMPFEFPVVLKPSDSMRYFETHFQGKKKAYILSDLQSLNKVMTSIREAGYSGTMIMQEYIAGDDTGMRVLNGYSDQEGKVRLLSLGQPLLEDPTPDLIGNYTAIIDAYDEPLMQMYQNFLQEIGYVGFFNFDMKYDAKSNTFKVFEINLRQGRSSYFATGSGYNLAKFLIEDVVEKVKYETVFARSEHLWLGMPAKTLFKYLKQPQLIERAEQRLKSGKISYTLKYSVELSLKRRIDVWRYYRGYQEKFKRYFVEKP